MDALTPFAVTRIGLETPDRQTCVFVAQTNSFRELVAYWNIRCANTRVLPYLVDHGLRQEALLNHFIHRSSGRSGNVPSLDAVYTLNEQLVRALPYKPDQVYAVGKSPPFPSSAPLRLQLQARSVLCTIDRSAEPPVIHLPMPDRPFGADRRFFSQHVIACVTTYATNVFTETDYVFPPPTVENLAEYYASKLRLTAEPVRPMQNGVGFFVSGTAAATACHMTVLPRCPPFQV